MPRTIDAAASPDRPRLHTGSGGPAEFEAQEEDRGTDLGTGSGQRRSRRMNARERIGRPHMEGGERKLEGETGEEKGGRDAQGRFFA